MKSIYLMLLALLVSACATGPTYHRAFSQGDKSPALTHQEHLNCIRDSHHVFGSVNQGFFVIDCMAALGHPLVDVLDDPQP